MDRMFWQQKWEKNDISFHASEVNPLLVTYFGTLSVAKGSRVFLPLCGKTLDMHWLLAHGYRVAGVELCRLAVEQLFAELGMTPQQSVQGELVRYSAKGIDIFVGDVFALSGDMLGPVDAIYDRAALVALDAESRNRYAVHLMHISGAAPQLLVSYQYDQSLMPGPPFSISDEEVERQYGDIYDVMLLNRAPVAGGLKGIVPASEGVWLLK